MIWWMDLESLACNGCVMKKKTQWHMLSRIRLKGKKIATFVELYLHNIFWTKTLYSYPKGWENDNLKLQTFLRCYAFVRYHLLSFPFSLHVFCVLLLGCSSLANTRLNHKWDVVWRPPIHFPVAEAWFPIVQSRLLGATNVYHKRLFVALSQSYQLYQMTYVKRQKSCWKQG